LYASIYLYYTAVTLFQQLYYRLPRPSTSSALRYHYAMSCQTSGYQYINSKGKLPHTQNYIVRIYAAVISIFLPLTLFHSKQTAPSTLNTDVATAT
jgi:hypothetical protein